jgi:hypothetical protein
MVQGATTDPAHHFIEMPDLVRPREPATQVAREGAVELRGPAPDRLVADVHAPPSQKCPAFEARRRTGHDIRL